MNRILITGMIRIDAEGELDGNIVLETEFFSSEKKDCSWLSFFITSHSAHHPQDDDTCWIDPTLVSWFIMKVHEVREEHEECMWVNGKSSRTEVRTQEELVDQHLEEV